MKHLRAIVRITLQEMASKANMKRFAQVRQMADPDVQRYIAFLDNAKTQRELSGKSYPTDHIEGLRDRTETFDGETLLSVLFDMKHERDAEISREMKQRERAAIDARKAERQTKKDALTAKIQRGFNNPVLKAALDKIGDGFHMKLKERYVGHRTNEVKGYFTDGVFNLKDPGYMDTSREGRAARNHYHEVRAALWMFFQKKESYSDKNEYLIPNWEAVIEREGQRYADEIVNSWKNKMSLKLGEVIDSKGGADIGLNGELWSEYMTFTFADGSSFNMRTSQVWSRSKLGKEFCRFPTTFHNVKFSDGTFMQVPSASKMQADFGISDSQG